MKKAIICRCHDGLICVQWPTEFDADGKWANWRERWFEPGQEADAEKLYQPRRNPRYLAARHGTSGNPRKAD